MDYSDEMLQIASNRFEVFNLENTECMQGDVGDMLFENETFDIVLSMNGVHAFPDKEKAFLEMKRVLKQDGLFIGCFYIKNERKITDWFIHKFFVKGGTFTPPFFTFDEVKAYLNSNYKEVDLWNIGSIIGFRCKK